MFKLGERTTEPLERHKDTLDRTPDGMEKVTGDSHANLLCGRDGALTNEVKTAGQLVADAGAKVPQPHGEAGTEVPQPRDEVIAEVAQQNFNLTDGDLAEREGKERIRNNICIESEGENYRATWMPD